jgi:hypothetical protein
MPTDLNPERFTLRQAAQARDDFAHLMDELGFSRRAGISLLSPEDSFRLGRSQRFVRNRPDRTILAPLPLRCRF